MPELLEQETSRFERGIMSADFSPIAMNCQAPIVAIRYDRKHGESNLVDELPRALLIVSATARHHQAAGPV